MGSGVATGDDVVYGWDVVRVGARRSECYISITLACGW